MDRPNVLIRAVLIAAAVFGFYFALQFYLGYADRGDDYPQYSTLRSDPMGTRALYGALERVEGLSVTRNTLPLVAYTPPPGAALIIHGAEVSPDPERMIEAIETWLDSGGRIVITHVPYRDGMLPWESFLAMTEDDEEEEQEAEGEGESETGVEESVKQENPARDAESESGETREGTEPDEEEDEETSARKRWAESIQGVWIDERWGFRYKFDAFQGQHSEAFLAEGQSGLSPSVAWWSGLYFAEPDEHWKVLYRRDKFPVIIERAWGNGSIAFCSDTYFLSNEAMKEERHPELLAWLIGDHKTIVFDESHLGVVQSPGMADLIRRFRFEGVMLALFISGLLIVWHGMSSLLPRRDRGGEDERAERGQETTAGLEALLKRSVPRALLMSQCVAEFEHTLEPGSPRRKRLERLRDLARHAESSGMTQEDVVHTYQRMRAVLSEKD